MRDRALELIARSDDDLTDVELFAQQGESFWYIDLCLDQLHRLPSEIDPILLCREYTEIQAYHTVKRAMNDLQMSRLRKD